jgi:predicted amidophosphoribosyltransferase
LDKGNLIRLKYTETQTTKTKTERWENVSSVFSVQNTKRFNGKHLLLIDDVITTGSTIEACASTILNSCNCKISIASLGYASY